jgi:hypothetical protein
MRVDFQLTQLLWSIVAQTCREFKVGANSSYNKSSGDLLQRISGHVACQSSVS